MECGDLGHDHLGQFWEGEADEEMRRPPQLLPRLEDRTAVNSPDKGILRVAPAVYPMSMESLAEIWRIESYGSTRVANVYVSVRGCAVRYESIAF